MNMLKRTRFITPIIMALGASAAFAGGDPWSYGGDNGPGQWGTLSPDFAACGIGQYQSPIDLKDGIPADLGGIQAEIQTSALRFGLDGPTFAVPYDAGSMLTINGTRYELQQFHFHHPSEHTLNGKHFPMEAHLVMKSVGSDHANAVLGVFIEEGSESAMLNQFWGQLPRSSNPKPEAVPVNVGDLLPENTAHFMYEGSMTTPGCREGVRWFVLEQPAQASEVQIERFIEDMTEGDSNNRPIQTTNARAILKGR
jgi:carbonic anhydrase